MRKYYLLVSDFDQTLSFNDSGLVLAEMLGIPGFQEKVANLSRLNLVQSGAELTYLLRHDPDFRRVREDDLVEVGRQIRLKRNIALLAEFLMDGIEGFSIRPGYDPERPLYSPAGGYVVKNDSPDPYRDNPKDVWLVQQPLFESTYEVLPVAEPKR